jgi:hypothetical protein
VGRPGAAAHASTALVLACCPQHLQLQRFSPRSVVSHCIQRGLPWATSLACTVMGQQEYYAELIKAYRWGTP